MFIRNSRYYLYLIFLITLQVFDTTTAYSNKTFIDLRNEYGKNKCFVEEVELPALIALTFFPELKNTTINFEYKDIKTTMSARPNINSLLTDDRAYVIYINVNAKLKGAVSFSELGLQEQIGIIAHELSHIKDYENRSTFSLIQCGIYYSIFKHYHRNLERETDMMVIKKGLGHQLFKFTNYVLHKSNASEEYKEFKLKNYLSPNEINDYL